MAVVATPLAKLFCPNALAVAPFAMLVWPVAVGVHRRSPKLRSPGRGAVSPFATAALARRRRV